MKRIYMHTSEVWWDTLSRKKREPWFNYDMLKEESSSTLNGGRILGKPAYGLWGSVFNYSTDWGTWEDKYIEEIRYYSSSGLDNAENIRDKAFFYVIKDEDKVFHISSEEDIKNLIIPYEDSEWKRTLDFDRIKELGYDGVEVHLNDLGIYYDKTFYKYDADSLVIWNPDCVQVVDREIATISRLANGVSNVIDQEHDHIVNKDYLIQWIEENEDKVKHAITDGIISFEDVATAFNISMHDLELYQNAQDVPEITDNCAERC